MRRALLLGLAPLLLASSCGPDAHQAGAAVLMSAPLAFASLGLLMWSVVALWRRFVGPLDVAWRGWWITLAVTVILGVEALLGGPARSFDWIGAAWAIYGGFFATLSLIFWRIALRQPAAVWGVPLAVSVLGLLPAYVMRFGSGADDFIAVWIVGSGYLWGAPIVYGLLLIEIAVRARRRRPR